MMHAMLEVDAEKSWWDTMPDKVKADVEAAIAEADKGETIPHEEIQKRYKKWLAK
jgi:predicted transcriptional regulator